MERHHRPWSREELLQAIHLYAQLPFGKMHYRNPQVMALAEMLDRSPGSVAFKLVNFASLDDQITGSGRKGASHASKLDREVWQYYREHWAMCLEEAQRLLDASARQALSPVEEVPFPALPNAGTATERTATYRARVGQHLFRKALLASYGACCITGCAQPALLVASHIRRWADDESQRLNPGNGLLLSVLHDKAFEEGLIAVSPEYKVLVSSTLLQSEDSFLNGSFAPYHGKTIRLPQRWLPDPALLEEHVQSRFRP